MEAQYGLVFIVKRFCSIFLLLGVLASCGETDTTEKEIAKIPLELRLTRFDVEFDNAKPENLADLKGRYPYLFPEQYPDSIWLAKMSDSLQIVLRTEVRERFSDFDQEAADLASLYKHVLYYFTDYKAPQVFTVTNDVAYQDRIMATDSILFISLDNYLGPDHEFYGSFPRFIAQGLDKEFLISDVASAVGNTLTPRPKDRSFLAQMIYYGKLLYIKDKIIPFETDANKIGYSEDQLAWVRANEEPIWRNFIENEYLYSTDNKLMPRFLDPAPFSKFGLELDNQSPGRVGRYIGWQIVRAYMEKNDISLPQMLNLSAEEIFKESNYKPKK
ncbi:gliding motility lipoprotein GldB [Aggregatimonas sangjinii]|uniref:Gliding motility lipoprotein GldB n=1 Tax=Aggregatimonas sangjinii TaxID=2583587 RepID=A0A5B7SU04_9FLAO|nr:gliding motility lipoprotein GldB [Aggregatimonas sangjinii]QCX02255.1 gliding motility lipoprotein GldB [Aggregatimonas sangjinii]